MDTKRLFLAAALSMAVLLVWPLIFPPPETEDAPAPAEEAAPLAETEPFRPEEPPVAFDPTPTEPAPEAPGREAEPEAVDPTEAEPERIRAERETTTTVETGTYRAEFSNRGGVLTSFQLFEHPDSRGEPVDLVRRRAVGPYPFALTDRSGRPDPVNDELFVVDRERYDDGAESVRFTYAGPAGRIVKTFLFEGEGSYRVSISAPEHDGFGVFLGPGVRNPSEQERTSRFAGQGGIYNLAGEVEIVNSARRDEPTPVTGSGLRWIGLQDTYFLTAWIPDSEEPLRQAVLAPVALRDDGQGVTTETAWLGTGAEPGDLKELVREQALFLVPQGDRFVGHAFFGAKEFDRLSGLPFGLERTVNLGFFSFIARPLLWGLRWIHANVVDNWGWAIVVMTLAIRLLLFPLTHKSFMSMQKMQLLNPKMQAIRQKYRPKLKDKQGRPNSEAQRKMNEEIMALYKAEGVNPAGGCLPMILQIPVFFAFYNLLSSAIELRHAPWLGWVRDLSAMDPYYALPIFMGVAMLVQQKMMPSTAEPMQRRMMMLMPFFITFICLKLPSGLALYWATSNVLGIVQQLFYNRLRSNDDSGSDKAGGKKEKKKDRS